MTAHRGPGRPPKPREDVADIKLDLRLTQEQALRFRQAAERAGYTLSGWLREAALEKLAREAPAE